MNVDEVESGKELSLLPGGEEYRLTFGYRHIKLSRWHYQQRRVRARRDRIADKVEQFKRAYPECKVWRSNIRGRIVIGARLDGWL